ncbi:MAG: alkaline phosphatase PafA [Bacteroidota bacterium]
MLRLIIVVFFIVITVFNIAAQGTKKIPGEKPKLIVAIVVDQMRYDYIYRYWEKYTASGFKRLINEGTFCKNTNLNYLFTQTGVGHASIFTGTYPSIHGIVSNEWFLNLSGKRVYCVADENVSTIGGNLNNGKFSPKNLFVTTIGDEMKLSDNKQSKVISISIKDRAAILAGGHMADAAYWYDSYTGKWITSSYYMTDLPQWVKIFNDKKYADIYLEKEWNTLLPIEKYTESTPDSMPYETGFANRKITFPYNLMEISKKGKDLKDYSILKSTPFGNTYTKDFALEAILNEDLGKDNYTDLLIISFSSTDYIGHDYGPMSVEVEDAYLRIDQELSHLLDFIDLEIGKENTLVFLTADHGVMQAPDYLKSQNVPSGQFKSYYSIALLKSYLNAIYGEAEWVKEYMDQQIFLNHTLIEDSKLSLSDIQTKTAQFLIQFAGVANAITATTLQTTYYSDGIFEKMQNSFNQKRSGDVLINLEPGWMESGIYTTTHNTGYTYDTHVPLIWYGWKIKRATITDPININDIVPTIATFLNIEFPSGTAGKPISKLLE